MNPRKPPGSRLEGHRGEEEEQSTTLGVVWEPAAQVTCGSERFKVGEVGGSLFAMLGV